MTIKEYLAGVPEMKSKDGTSLKDTMADVVSIWSNDACSGYCIDALQHAGYSREQIREVLAELQASFNGISVEEAERLYIEY